MEEFVKTGKFGFLRLGMTKKEIVSQKFPPEDWAAGKTKETSPIWRYGNFELHFDEKNRLERIFNDYVPEIDGGKSIDITNWWIISKDNSGPTLETTLSHLNLMKLDYRKENVVPGNMKLKLGNGVYFCFDHQEEDAGEDQNIWGMTVIAKENEL